MEAISFYESSLCAELIKSLLREKSAEEKIVKLNLKWHFLRRRQEESSSKDSKISFHNFTKRWKKNATIFKSVFLQSKSCGLVSCERVIMTIYWLCEKWIEEERNEFIFPIILFHL